MALIPGKRRISKSATQYRRQQRQAPSQNHESMLEDARVKDHCQEEMDDPECQCYLRRGTFLPPGLDPLEDKDNTEDGAYGKS